MSRVRDPKSRRPALVLGSTQRNINQSICAYSSKLLWDAQVEGNQISIADPNDTGPNKREPKAFTYDFAYDWTSNQEGVYVDLGAPIVTRALQGYNG